MGNCRRKSDPAHINSQPAILSLIPCIGPLHIFLSGRETVLKDFVDFFENIYNHLFPRSKLPKTLRPWRISLILESGLWRLPVYQGSYERKFKVCKDIEYMTLLNLLDNYKPLVLAI